MFFKHDRQSILLRKNADSDPIPVPFDSFAFLGTVTYGAGSDSVILTGIRKGAKMPNLQSRERGEIRLFRYMLTGGEWKQITKIYAHHAVEIPGSANIAFY